MSDNHFLELHKIRSCWPTKLINGIPLSELMLKKNSISSKYKNVLKNSVNLDPDLIDFIFFLVDNQNLSLETAESSVIVVQYFLKNSKNVNKYTLQLIAMVSVFICSKIFDIKRFTLAHLHQISEYKYNNKMVMKCEFDILKALNYDIFLRDNTLVNKVGLYLETVRDFFEKEDFDILEETTHQFIQLLYSDMKLIKNYGIDFLCVGIIQAVFCQQKRRKKYGRYDFTGHSGPHHSSGRRHRFHRCGLCAGDGAEGGLRPS